MANSNFKVHVGVYQNIVSDLSETMKFLEENGCDLVAAPIVHPMFRRQFSVTSDDDDSIQTKHMAFSRSDLLLQSTEWMYKFVSKITDTIDCDSENITLRKHSEQTLMQELSFADHLIQHGFVMIRLKGVNTMNLSRIVSKNIKGSVLMEVPMQNPKKFAKLHVAANAITDNDDTIRSSMTNDDEDDDNYHEPADENPWTWWNKFRLQTDFHNKIMVALELSADLPSSDEIQRWLCEPVSCLIIPSHIFIHNAQNYPVLSKAHQSVIASFIKNDISFMIKCNYMDNSLRNYADYLRYLGQMHSPQKEPMHGFDDILEIPLQPLYDNLDTYTYEIFEKDPVKYALYQKAIELALIDKVPENEIPNRTVNYYYYIVSLRC